MKRKTVVVIVAAILMSLFSISVFSPVALAAGKFKYAEVQVWPDYDKPSVLIMWWVQAPGLKEVTIPFPKGTQLGKVVSYDSNKKQSPINDVKSKEEGDYLNASFSLPKDTFFVEGYWNDLSKAGNKKFTLDLKVPLDADQLNVFIQKPLKSTNFNINPQPKGFQKDQSTKIDAASYSFTNKKAGESLKFDVSYTKTDASLSYQLAGQNTSTSTNTTPATSSADVKTVVLVVLALMFFVIGGVAFYNYRQNTLAESGLTAKRGAHKGSKFCPNCGAKVEGKFCGECGERLS